MVRESKIEGKKIFWQIRIPLILLQKAGSRSLGEIAIEMGRKISIRAPISEGDCDQGKGRDEG